MKHWVWMTLWILMSAGAVSADGDRARHYEHAARQPQSVEQARQILQETSANMAEYVDKQDYEEVHELSYSLESAVKWLKSDTKQSELAIKQLELIEIYTDLVHHGSEDGKYDKVHRYFPKLEAEIDTYIDESD